MPVYRKAGEGSAFPVRIRCYDDANDPTVPRAMKYRIDCETTGETVREWTSVSPAADVTVQVTAEDNRIIDDRNAKEVRTMTVVIDDDLDTQFVSPIPFQWAITNVGRGKKVVP